MSKANKSHSQEEDNMSTHNIVSEKQDSNISKPKPISQAKQLLAIVNQHEATLFRSTDVQPYISFTSQSAMRTLELYKAPFQHYMLHQYCKASPKHSIPSDKARKAAKEKLVADAMSGGDVRPVYNRIGQHQCSIYIHLARQDNKAISINADGWQVIDNPPIIFHRPDTQAPLPLPQEGNIDLLSQHINIAKHYMPSCAHAG